MAGHNPTTSQQPQVDESPESPETSADLLPVASVDPAVIRHDDPVHDTAIDLSLRVEAALMSTDRPLSANQLSQLLGEVGVKAVNQAVEELNKIYVDTGRSFRIENIAGGWQCLTLPRFAPVLRAMHKTRQSMKLGPAALETLAIIAYKQPILRADVEAIRGVACGEMIRGLMERRLVKIVGRAQELGRPMLYGTTKTFLEVFGLSSLKDLPKPEDLHPKVSS